MVAISVFHGDDLASSRTALNSVIDSLRKQDILIHYLDGNRLTPADLEIALTTANLFQQEALVIENLFARLKSKDQKDCLEMLASYTGPKQLILWDKKELTKTQLKVLPQANAKLSKTPVIIWKLIDTLSPTSRRYSLDLLKQTLEQADEGFVFIMLARRVSDLIIAKSGDTSKLSPWLRSRLITQAQPWDETTLIELHSLLTEYDYKLKTGGTKLSYAAILDITLSTLLD